MKECLWLIDLQQLAESSANRQLVACRAYRGYPNPKQVPRFRA